MTQILTARELLAQQSDAVSHADNDLPINADLPLDQAAVDYIKGMLRHDRSISGLNIVTDAEESLGVISKKSLTLYNRELAIARNDKEMTMGGNVGTLEGVPDFPESGGGYVFVCKKHDTKAFAIIQPWPSCPQCNQEMVFHSRR